MLGQGDLVLSEVEEIKVFSYYRMCSLTIECVLLQMVGQGDLELGEVEEIKAHASVHTHTFSLSHTHTRTHALSHFTFYSK